MNIVQIEENVKQLIHKIAQDELKQQDFIYELLLAYGHRNQSVWRVRSGERNLAEDKENSVFWKRQLYFKIARQQDLHVLIDEMKKEKRTETNKIRFLIVTDFKTILAIDTKTNDPLDVPFSDLAKKFDFFLPWAGMEKALYQGENPADVKAAEKLAKLFDEIKADNFDENDLNNKDNLHQLNIFLSRLLFCYFAEDTEIFKDKQFTSAISKSNEDGSDLSALIGRLFKVLNQSAEDREADLPDYLADFPYVNGSLFKDDIQFPKFTRKSRRILIECGAELDWSDINPDIFGSMFQAVVHTEQRSTMGQHYTSVPNIMKVIEPLFLNELYEKLDKNQDSINKLLKLQQRLGQLKIFDPACGSGNFLIIAYKELRKFEMEVLKRIQELELEKTGQFSKPFSLIQVSQFYGIEIDDFAHEIAILSLWLAEHQMNLMFKIELGEYLPSLPLKRSGNIVSGNATLIEWEEVCENNGDIYILGNPPYLGAKRQSKKQKEDMEMVFINSKTYKNLDYISCWFFKAAQYIENNPSTKSGFVSTNSIAQGDQANLLWTELNRFKNIEIGFAYTSFKWGNSAKDQAAVICVIIGLEYCKDKPKYIYNSQHVIKTQKIGPYLTPNSNILVSKRAKPLSELPEMAYGNMPLEGGFLKLTKEEKDNLLAKHPDAKRFLRPVVGGEEFLKNFERWCLWIDDSQLNDAMEIPDIKTRIDNVLKFRLTGGDVARTLVDRPHQFRYRRESQNYSIVVPCTSSERRDYIQCGFYSKEYISMNSVQVVYDADPYVFGILSSRMHMLWVKLVSGRLKSDIRYSNIISYNTYPVPKISSDVREAISLAALNILEVRESFPTLTIGNMYIPEKMPISLLNAHRELDEIIEKIYSSKPFNSDEERINVLLNLYEQLSSN